MQVDLRMLVIGYLSTVALRLDQRGFPVRELHAQQPDSPTLWGELTLTPAPAPAPAPGAGWSPTRLRWEQNSGWSATLSPTARTVGDGGRAERRAVLRYLPATLVPAPVTVVHFAAALRTDPDSMWARATFRPPRPIDRRWLILQLARFAMPEP